MQTSQTQWSDSQSSCALPQEGLSLWSISMKPFFLSFCCHPQIPSSWLFCCSSWWCCDGNFCSMSLIFCSCSSSFFVVELCICSVRSVFLSSWRLVTGHFCVELLDLFLQLDLFFVTVIVFGQICSVWFSVLWLVSILDKRWDVLRSVLVSSAHFPLGALHNQHRFVLPLTFWHLVRSNNWWAFHCIYLVPDL